MTDDLITIPGEIKRKLLNHATPQSIRLLERARTGNIYLISDNKHKLILKIVFDGEIYSDIFFFQTLKDIVPVPKVFDYHIKEDSDDDTWILMEYVENKRPVDERKAGKSTGTHVKKIHSIKVEGAGGYYKDGFEFDNFSQFLDKHVNMLLNWLFEAKINNYESYANYLESIDDDVAFQSKSFLLHGDLSPENILFRENTVAAFIDSGWCVGGHPLFDMAYMLNARENTQTFIEGVLSVYPITNTDLLNKFRLFHYLSKIKYAWEGKLTGKVTSRTKRLESFWDKEINSSSLINS